MQLWIAEHGCSWMTLHFKGLSHEGYTLLLLGCSWLLPVAWAIWIQTGQEMAETQANKPAEGMLWSSPF